MSEIFKDTLNKIVYNQQVQPFYITVVLDYGRDFTDVNLPQTALAQRVGLASGSRWPAYMMLQR